MECSVLFTDEFGHWWDGLETEKLTAMAIRNFKELQAKMSPERQVRNQAAAQRMLRDLPLEELRAARELTQEQLAAVLGVKQASISKLEHRTDMYVTTLAKFIEAMGGKLEIRAVFPDGAVRISQFGENR